MVKISQEPSCCQTPQKKWHWYRDKLLWMLIVLSFVLLLGLFIPFLKPFDDAFVRYSKMIWWAMVIGLFLGGVIDYYIPKTYVSKLLAQKHKRTIFYSVGLGFLMSACSHGILALAMQLHKKGASGPSVVSFLLASPWANIPITFLLFAFFGFKGFLIVISALLIALTTGFIFQKLEATGKIEKNVHSVLIEEGFSIRKDISRRWKEYCFSWSGMIQDARGVVKGIWELSQMVLWWMVLGFVIASVTSAYVPAGIFHRFLGSNLMGLFITLTCATLIEICSEGSAPLAFEIYRQTGALGNSFVFLMAGVATDYTEIGLVWSNLGKKTALWMILICVPQILLLGWIYNLIF